MSLRGLFACFLLAMLGACQRSNHALVEFVGNPVPAGAGQVSLTVNADQQAVLSWVQVGADGVAQLRYSRRLGEAWDAPRTVASGNNWFVNWADFPALHVAPDGTWLAHWLQKSADRSYAYDVMTKISTDDGQTWSATMKPHRDNTKTEHGFVSYFTTNGAPAMAWLDGRLTSGEGHEHSGGPMTLRAATLSDQRQWGPSVELDGRVCDCCGTAAAVTSAGPIVVYRDRSDDEIRDIAIVRQVNGQWTTPQPVFNDGWRIAGCPVNGPAVAAAGRQVAVAWFTQAADQPTVKLALSDDAGATFALPLQLSEHQPLGRVKVVWLDSSRAAVSWFEMDPFDDTRLRLAVVEDGAVIQRSELGQTLSTRSAGFPAMVQAADKLWVAWREVDADGGAARVRTAALDYRS